ncbi:5-bromo-4-chloroindolyl phosphate hydrolysis family protein [Abyssibius alkaniclasticus]|uniref:5-bromo-4-chloroindolyl phosphate hydrolysis family protein n=1 Tax=Abyssibius alkaniclasticus TaxID=2881234 RepID=UPI0023641992|nr:5-bromo-4-chloroindolyl phosphate hydrolysis family protein [Abyssibius alkaniclasticus]UPH69904.1 5-bromo-4-chloroindolyl phosphate hydrolysis family protein [Abyssibius alkaniclasticus]
MAQRFGGEHSPKPNPATTQPRARAFAGRAAQPSRIRVTLIYIAAMPLLLAALFRMFGGNAFAMLGDLAGFALVVGGAALLGEGIRAEAAYNARKMARPPAIPRKVFGSISIGLGICVAALFGWGLGVFSALAFGGVAFGASLLSFGFDPMRKKGMAGVDDFTVNRVATAVEQAEVTVRQMIEAAARIPDRVLEGRIDALAVAAREMFRVVEDDPRDLSAARKFMTVYLAGARDATLKYADLARRGSNASARADFEALLGDLEQSFEAQREKLLEDNRSDLDVEIEVLRERLQREGVNAQ